jgi:hypothetical protein
MKAVITLKMLTDAGACSDQVDLFRSMYGDSVNVTVARAKKVAGIFDWNFARRFLDKQGEAEYQRITGPAWAEYERIKGVASAEYERIRGAAWAEYNIITGAALAEYNIIRGPAWAEYNIIRGTAWAEAYIATCKRQASTGAVS